MQVLIAEDDLATQKQLELVIKRWGYQAICVGDGESAKQVLDSQSAPQLAIVDWQMPGMNGPTLCRHLRSLPREKYVFVILLTARSDSESLLAGLAAGADDFVRKPFNPMELRLRLGTGQRIIELQESLRLQATRDALTGLRNRAEILRICERESDRAVRGHYPTGVILADLDHFKQINDRHGHLAGDAVLRQVSSILSEEIRTYDSVGRYGGEEFLIVLPDADQRETLSVAERIRLSVARHEFLFDGGKLHFSLSLGAALISNVEHLTTEEALRRADDALYSAKARGRNCVCAVWDQKTEKPTFVEEPQWLAGREERGDTDETTQTGCASRMHF